MNIFWRFAEAMTCLPLIMVWMPDKQIIAIGGRVGQPGDGDTRIERFILESSGKRAPHVCFVPTASGDNAEFINQIQSTYTGLGVKADVLRFFDRTPADLPEYMSSFDIIQVGGGNTRSMLAVWRHWGLDVLVRQTWERGALLCGSSAGSLCWFENGLTDSVADSYTAMDGLGFISGSNCVHYFAPDRRETYHALIEGGELSPGIACPDGVAAHYRGDKLLRVVSCTPDQSAYYVEKVDGEIVESALPTTVLK
ncbi:MAG TPA: peptidase E [Candidatus Baltobacteraceae bacterium]